MDLFYNGYCLEFGLYLEYYYKNLFWNTQWMAMHFKDIGYSFKLKYDCYSNIKHTLKKY